MAKQRQKYATAWLVGILAICLLSAIPFSQLRPQNESATVSSSTERKFRRDAARLALRANALDGDVSSLPVIIPKSPWDEFYKMLDAIYRAEPIARGLENCNIHTFPNPSIDHLIVVVERNIGWAMALKSGSQQTTNGKVNSLRKNFKLVTEYVQWDDTYDAITIHSSASLNMPALAKKFESVDGVVRVELGIPTTSGNDIQVRRVSGGWEVTYLLRFRSGADGSTKEHRWVFLYSHSGNVQFKGESGDPVPAWMRCEP